MVKKRQSTRTAHIEKKKKRKRERERKLVSWIKTLTSYLSKYLSVGPRFKRKVGLVGKLTFRISLDVSAERCIVGSRGASQLGGVF